MKNKKINGCVSYALIIFSVALSGVLGIIFFSLFIKTIESGFLFENANLVIAMVSVVLTLCAVLSIAFLYTKYKIVSKTFILTTVLLCLSALLLYFLGKNGFFDKIT